VSESSRSGSQLPGISTLTKAEATYLALRERILEGSLPPGSTINQERLAADLGLSITPLREALRRLEAEELVALSAHKIVSVAPLTWQELRELCVTREQLDPLAATLAANQATDQEARTIAALAAQPRPSDLRGRLAAHREFHLAIYAAAHNKVLAGILGQLWDRTDRYRIIVLRDRDFDHSTGAEHSKIAEAIRARDDAMVADLMRHHVNEALHSVERIAVREPILGGGPPSVLNEGRLPGSRVSRLG
jgi:DNA-binding GntR family transcriptional regulator